MRLGVGAIALLAGCKFTSPESTDAAPIKDAPRDGSDGAIDAADAPPASNIFEAEAFTSDKPGTVTPIRSWAPATAFAGFSGASYMQCGPGTGAFCADDANLDTCAASMTYQLAIVDAGVQHVHVLALAVDTSDDSAYYGIDGTSLGELDFTHDSNWHWKTGAATVTLAAGGHTLTIWQRECGAKLDKVAVTTSATPPP